MAQQLKRTKAPSGGSSEQLVPQLRADSKKKPTRPQPSKEIAPKEKGGIFKDIFDIILRAKNRDRLIDQAIEDATGGKQPQTKN